MRALAVIALTATWLGAGCIGPKPFVCADQAADACGPNATCEPSGYCSRPDSVCDSGDRYVSSAGEFSGRCTDQVGGLDGGADAARDGDTGDASIEPADVCIVGDRNNRTGTCAALVCERAPSCCTADWYDECVDIAEVVCDVSCSTGLATSGYQALSVTTTVNGSSWSSAALESADQWAWDLDWADFDGDGDADLVMSATCTLKVFRNDGFNGSQLQLSEVLSHTFAGTNCQGYVAWGDADNDGDLDVATSGPWGLVIASNDAGTITVDATALQTNADSQNLEWADLDTDGDMDLLLGIAYDQTELWENTPTGLVKTAWQGPPHVREIKTCHLGGTEPKAPALVFITSNQVSLIPSSGSGAMPGTTARWTVSAPMGVYQAVHCGDLDGDGIAEIIAATRDEDPGEGIGNRNDPGYARVLALADGATLWTSPTILNVERFDLGDVNSDGRLDVVFSDNPWGADFDTPEPFGIFLRDAGSAPAFTQLGGQDFVAASDAIGIELVHLPRPAAAKRK